MKTKWLRSGFFARHRIEVLMWALVAEMLVSPLADTHPHAGALLGFVVLLIVLAGIREIAVRSMVHKIVLPVAAFWVVTRILEAFGDSSKLYANLSPAAGLVFSCLILWAIFDHFHSRSRNLRTAIAEAFIGYLVLATAFSQLYGVLDHLLEHAFNQAIPPSQHGTLLYFSMITMTSVGYGVIAPINPYVRMVAAFESMCGIFFVAVVVARLVTSYSPRQTAQHHYLASEVYQSDDQPRMSFEPSNVEADRMRE